MAIVINGSGTVTGLSVGGLPDGTVDAGTLATNSVDSAELIDGAVDDSHMAAMAASKLTGALPAISGASLTGITTGKVLQVVQNTLDTSNFTTTSTSNTASGKSVSITPTTSGNKMLVTVSGLMYNTADANSWGSVVIKDTTNGTFSATNDKIGRATTEEQFTVSHLFTTESASSHNYELWSGGSDAGTKNFDNIQILIMEIAV